MEQLMIPEVKFHCGIANARLRQEESVARRKANALEARIDGEPMPLQEDLPGELRPLLARQDIELHQKSFDRDLAELLNKMKLWLTGSAHEAAKRKATGDQLPALCQLCDRTPQENALPAAAE